MHLKVFLKLKKTLKTLSSGKIYIKKQKTPKTQKNKTKKTTGLGFFYTYKGGHVRLGIGKRAISAPHKNFQISINVGSTGHILYVLLFIYMTVTLDIGTGTCFRRLIHSQRINRYKVSVF
jgi:hypothetical protein